MFPLPCPLNNFFVPAAPTIPPLLQLARTIVTKREHSPVATPGPPPYVGGYSAMPGPPPYLAGYSAMPGANRPLGGYGWLMLLLLFFSQVQFAQAIPVQLETPSFLFSIQPDNGKCELRGRDSNAPWRSSADVFGHVSFRQGGQPGSAALAQCEVTRVDAGLNLKFLAGNKPENFIRVLLRPNNDGRALAVSYEAAPGVEIENIRLLDGLLTVTSAANGYVVVPAREGLLIPADSGKIFSHYFDTSAYEGCHMQMAGLVNAGSALLITWNDLYAGLELNSSVSTNPAPQRIQAAVVLKKTARSFQIEFLGQGSYVEIGKAYRRTATEKGLRIPWENKLRGHAERARLFGAINFKLWSALDRRMDESSTREERIRVNWTFDEAAQVAEHLKRDLQLEKVLFIMGGWIHRGYDNQHPDILPSAPECGGDAAFADCARRVRQLGYVFCLHDNYQDIYRDSPSWDERWVAKNRDGSLMRGGHWAGGRAYLTCSKQALELARRPENLQAVLKLTGAGAYFIDTTYAAGLQECFDPNHPLSRSDDLKWKQAISDYARELFGIFGSECGREWAVPHSDFFEGFSGVSGRSYHDTNLVNKVGGVVVPLFELVYHDCIAIYGKYGYDPKHSAEYVLRHLSLGRPLHYHSVPSHLYWKSATGERNSDEPAAVFTRGNGGWTEGLHPLDRFVKNTAEILGPLNELTAMTLLENHEFLTANRQVQRSTFGSGADTIEAVMNFGAEPYRYSARQREIIIPQYGFVIDGPHFAAFHALKWGGLNYEQPVLFTLRSLDGEPLERSRRVRVFPGFGEPRLNFRGVVRSIAKEEILQF